MSTMIRKTIIAFAMVAITMAMAIALSSISVSYKQAPQVSGNINFQDEKEANKMDLVPSKRVSRFLAESNGYNHHGRSLKPADHCHKDNELCDIMYGNNYTCCGNKCYDLTIAKNHCGACHNKCKFTYDCCNGKCVDKAYDKRHCGRCNNKCLKGQYCVYGMCDYA